MATQLPHLPEVTQLSPRVIRILGGNPSKFTLQGTNTYLIGTGPSRILIDTGQGFASWKNALSSVLKRDSIRITDAIITHWHEDHTLGIPDLLSLQPDVRLHKYLPDYEPPPQHTTLQPKPAYHAIQPSQTFTIPSSTQDSDSTTLTAVPTPGHTTDHLTLLLHPENALFSGDAVLGHGTAVFEDLASYIASLSALLALPSFTGRVYPGHGEVVEDGRGKVQEYIAHRRKREEEVLGVLEAKGEVSAGEIVQVVYRDVPANLHEAARGGVLLILGKLEKEGAVGGAGAGVNRKWKIVKDEEKASL